MGDGGSCFRSTLNQFQSRDSFQGYVNYPISQNPYLYVYNSPINYIDPTGHDAWWCDHQDYFNVPSHAVQDAIQNCHAQYIDGLMGHGRERSQPPARRYLIGLDMLINVVEPEFFGDVYHETKNIKCTSDNYVECWDKNARLIFEDYDEIDPIQFKELETVVYEQLCNSTKLSDFNRIIYDTPIFNSGSTDDHILCYQGECVPRSHINYFAQGAWSARLGQPKLQMYMVINEYKRFKHRYDSEYTVPQSIYDWAEYGYDAYLNYEREKSHATDDINVVP